MDNFRTARRTGGTSATVSRNLSEADFRIFAILVSGRKTKERTKGLASVGIGLAWEIAKAEIRKELGLP